MFTRSRENPREQMYQTSTPGIVGIPPRGTSYEYIEIIQPQIPPRQRHQSQSTSGYPPDPRHRNGARVASPSPSNQGSASPGHSQRPTPQPPLPSVGSEAQPRTSLSSSRTAPQSPSKPVQPPQWQDHQQIYGDERLAHEVHQAEQRNIELDNLRHQLREEKNRAENLAKELKIAREDHSSLRANLQLDDDIEPGQMAKEFQAINRSIEDASRAISGWFCGIFTFDGIDAPTTAHVVDQKRLYDLMPYASSRNSTLIRSSRSEFRPLEEFIDFFLRCILVRKVHHEILAPLHPHLNASVETRGTFERVYKEMQKHESQIVCGRWRSMSFNGLQSTLGPNWDREYAGEQTRQFEVQTIYPLFEVIYGVKRPVGVSHEVIDMQDTHRTQLYQLFSKCLEWNKRAKGQMYSVEYISFLVANKGAFIPDKMRHLDSHNKETREIHIVAAVTLGLLAEKVQGKGWGPGTNPDPVPLESRVLEKVAVITDDYFRVDR